METNPTLDALLEAQKIAFGPIAFQVARLMQRFGLLAALKAAGCQGLSCEELARDHNIAKYGLIVLLRAAVASGMLTQNEERFHLALVGRMLCQDELTGSNVDFVHHICYKAMFHLEEAILSGKPAGLREIGDYNTFYEGLSQVDAPLRASWLAWDHLYSDSAFQAALAIVFSRPVASLLDVGGNTGRWLRLCAAKSPATRLGMFDLPQQITLATESLRQDGATSGARIGFHPGNILQTEGTLPQGYDVIWMSQFLDCFAPAEIMTILGKAGAALSPAGTLYIMEVCTDNQNYKVADYIVNMSSPYFTCIANGNSRFYASSELSELIVNSGFRITRRYSGLGLAHTLLECSIACL